MSDHEPPELYTIGHSNLDMERFLDYLRQYGVSAVIDVRSRPQSRFFPWFNRRNLSAQLSEAGIAYSFIDYQRDGEQIQLKLHDRSDSKQKPFDNALGGYPKDASVYPEPGLIGPKAVKKMDTETERPAYYERIMTKDWFQQGIAQLRDALAENERVALLCSCRDWRDCHRENLIARYLRRQSPAPAIQHITYEGELQGAPDANA